MYSQVDSEGFSHSILSGIFISAKDTIAVQKCDQYIITKSGQCCMRKSTVGWDLLIDCKDVSKKWIPLLVMRESNPIEVDEFTSPHSIYDGPVSTWWFPYTLQKRDEIISAVNAQVK